MAISFRYVCTANCGFVTDTRADLVEDCCPHCGDEVVPEEGDVQVYQVGVCYWQQHGADVQVKARVDTPLEKVCEIAIARADGDPSVFRPVATVTDSYVDIVERGRRVNPDDDLPILDTPAAVSDAHILLTPEVRAKLKHFDDLADLARRYTDSIDANFAIDFDNLMNRVRADQAEERVSESQAASDATCPVCGSADPGFDGCAWPEGTPGCRYPK